MQKRFATLTGIRGAAAVWVLTFHAYPLVSQMFNWPDRTEVPVIRDGFLAVDLFFILSGFVLSHAYADSLRTNLRDAYGSFLAARVRRIFPLHWVCLSIMVLLVKSFPDHGWGPGPFSPQSLAGSALLIQNWAWPIALAWNHPAWSLSAEWFAYLVFPLVAWALGSLNDRTVALGGAVLALLVLVVCVFGLGSGTLDHVGKGGMGRCLCEFLAGAFIWKAWRGGYRFAPAEGDACLAMGIALLGLALAMPSAQGVAPFALAAIVSGCVLPSRLGSWLFGGRLVTGLGEISFSIYLIHIPIIGSLALVADRYRLQDAGVLPRIALLLAIPALVLGASILLWHFVEIPSRMLLRPWPLADRLRKPERRASVMLTFWPVMIVAMTFSETAADFLSDTVALGYCLSTALLLAAAATIPLARTEAGLSGANFDWMLALLIGMAGTTLSDFLDVSLGMGDFHAAIFLGLTLLALWHPFRLVQAAAPSANLWESGLFRGLMVLLAAALCTSLGDLVAAYSGLHYVGTSLMILGALVCVALAAAGTRLPRTPLFWAAFVLIRALGATMGDALTKSHAEGGLQLGPGNSSLILAASMIVLIPICGRGLAELIARLQDLRLVPAQA